MEPTTPTFVSHVLLYAGIVMLLIYAGIVMRLLLPRVFRYITSVFTWITTCKSEPECPHFTDVERLKRFVNDQYYHLRFSIQVSDVNKQCVITMKVAFDDPPNELVCDYRAYPASESVGRSILDDLTFLITDHTRRIRESSSGELIEVDPGNGNYTNCYSLTHFTSLMRDARKCTGQVNAQLCIDHAKLEFTGTGLAIYRALCAQLFRPEVERFHRDVCMLQIHLPTPHLNNHRANPS